MNRFTAIQNPVGTFGIMDWVNLKIVDGWYTSEVIAEDLADDMSKEDEINSRIESIRPPTSHWLR